MEVSSSLAVMNTTNRYRYEFPPHLTVLLILFYFGLSAWMAYLARSFAEVQHVGFIALSVIFATLALVVLVRRLAFPCTLELTEDSILLPRGHPWPRITTITFADIICLQDGGDSLWINTSRDSFSIWTNKFEDYPAVREAIAVKAAIALEPSGSYDHPAPLVQWVEPEDWTRFLARAEITKPVLYQLHTELWFFVRCYAFCFAFIVVPFLCFVLLIFFGWGPFLLVAVSIRPFAAVFFLAVIFTMLHWLDRIFPVHAEKIRFLKRGITKRNPSGQLFVWDYRQFSGWVVIERQFKEHILQILLLKQLVKGRAYTQEFAFPDASVRDQVVQILNDRQVPQALDIKPSWEAE
jgi:hypothetical protein